MQQRARRGSKPNTGSRYGGGNYTEMTSHSALKSEKSYGRSVYGGKTFEERPGQPKKKQAAGGHAHKKDHRPRQKPNGHKTLGKFEGGKRVYFFDVQETGGGDKALSITQTRNDNGRQRRDTVLIFEDHIDDFMKALARAAKKL